mmetsp:Transcript_13472/g.16068  ORF Transcript_13472/g.16068 Transcript_13472/m.16068 type:complete len:158 (+) Transcript_13472:158-631(+)
MGSRTTPPPPPNPNHSRQQGTSSSAQRRMMKMREKKVKKATSTKHRNGGGEMTAAIITNEVGRKGWGGEEWHYSTVKKKNHQAMCISLPLNGVGTFLLLILLLISIGWFVRDFTELSLGLSLSLILCVIYSIVVLGYPFSLCLYMQIHTNRATIRHT